jgi:hypothetical protein
MQGNWYAHGVDKYVHVCVWAQICKWQHNLVMCVWAISVIGVVQWCLDVLQYRQRLRLQPCDALTEQE